MLLGQADAVDRMAQTVAQYRATISPLVNQIYSVVGGSARAVDSGMAAQLNAVMSALGSAESALAQAAAQTRAAHHAEVAAQAAREEAARRAAAQHHGGGGY